MSMSKVDRKRIDDTIGFLNDAVVELRDRVIEAERKLIELEGKLHQEIVTLKHKNGLK